MALLIPKRGAWYAHYFSSTSTAFVLGLRPYEHRVSNWMNALLSFHYMLIVASGMALRANEVMSELEKEPCGACEKQ